MSSHRRGLAPRVTCTHSQRWEGTMSSARPPSHGHALAAACVLAAASAREGGQHAGNAPTRGSAGSPCAALRARSAELLPEGAEEPGPLEHNRGRQLPERGLRLRGRQCMRQQLPQVCAPQQLLRLLRRRRPLLPPSPGRPRGVAPPVAHQSGIQLHEAHCALQGARRLLELTDPALQAPQPGRLAPVVPQDVAALQALPGLEAGGATVGEHLLEADPEAKGICQVQQGFDQLLVVVGVASIGDPA
mmetsp:Transcript_62623/g.173579  ORF Transcript_62623/g.173579 Transcript_62623/m.173579 type:complete len:246 (-) Transcript_62623:560-1297(-)